MIEKLFPITIPIPQYACKRCSSTQDSSLQRFIFQAKLATTAIIGHPVTVLLIPASYFAVSLAASVHSTGILVLVTLGALYMSAGVVKVICNTYKWLKTESYKRCHALEKIFNQKIILVLEAAQDSNQTFQHHISKGIERIASVAFKRVSTLTDIANAIKTAHAQGNKISGLVLRAHGTAKSIMFSAPTKERPNTFMHLDLGKPIAECFKELDKEAFILLESCLTGKQKVGKNIAQVVAESAPNHLVIAPTLDLLPKAIAVSSDGEIQLRQNKAVANVTNAGKPANIAISDVFITTLWLFVWQFAPRLISVIDRLTSVIDVSVRYRCSERSYFGLFKRKVLEKL